MDDQSPSWTRTINAMKARQTFGQLLNEVFYRGDHFVIERDGRPMAALVPLAQLEALQKHSGPAKAEHDMSKETKRRSKKK